RAGRGPPPRPPGAARRHTARSGTRSPPAKRGGPPPDGASRPGHHPDCLPVPQDFATREIQGKKRHTPSYTTRPTCATGSATEKSSCRKSKRATGFEPATPSLGSWREKTVTTCKKTTYGTRT